MGPIISDISNFSETLYKESLDLFLCFEVFKFDEINHKLQEMENADDIRLELFNKKQIKSMWISFSVGYELLLKAVLIMHQALPVQYKPVSKRMNQCPDNEKIPQIIKAYSFIENVLIKATTNIYLHTLLHKHKISHLYDFNSGTIGSLINNLKILETNKIITSTERNLLYWSSFTLLDMRRNIDMHNFYGFMVTRDINGDLPDIYLPAINLLIDIYHRS